MRLHVELPVDHPLSKVYRFGAGAIGVVLLIFGILGFTGNVGFFSTSGVTVGGLSTNGALSLISVIFGLVLTAGAVRGGNTASTVNGVVGVLFVLSGFANLIVLERSINFLAFRIQNVLFSFVVGVLLMFFGMYGRVSGGLPHDNPYWRARHPDAATREERARRRIPPRTLPPDGLPDGGAPWTGAPSTGAPSAVVPPIRPAGGPPDRRVGVAGGVAGGAAEGGRVGGDGAAPESIRQAGPSFHRFRGHLALKRRA